MSIDITAADMTEIAGTQTPRETLIGYLDAMTDEQAAPVLTVLGWIATLTVDQATTLVALLTNTPQGDPQ